MTLKQWIQAKVLSVRVWVNAVITTTFTHAHALYASVLKAVVSEFSSWRRIVITLFLTALLADIVLNGRWQIAAFILNLLKELKDIVIATGLAGIAGIVIITLAVLLKDKKVI